MKNTHVAILAGVALLSAALGDSRPALSTALGGSRPVFSASPGTSVTTGQPGAKPLKGKAKRLQMLVTQLGLSDDQVAQVKSIYTAEENKARSVKTNADLSPDEKRTQLEALRKDTRQQLDAVLTAAQRRKLRQLQRDRLASAGTPATPAGPAGTAPATPAEAGGTAPATATQ